MLFLNKLLVCFLKISEKGVWFTQSPLLGSAPENMRINVSNKESTPDTNEILRFRTSRTWTRANRIRPMEISLRTGCSALGSFYPTAIYLTSDSTYDSASRTVDTLYAECILWTYGLLGSLYRNCVGYIWQLMNWHRLYCSQRNH